MNAKMTSLLPMVILLVVAGCKTQTQQTAQSEQAASSPAPSAPVVNPTPAIVQPIVPTPLSLKDSEFLANVNRQFIPSENYRNEHIALDEEKLVYEENVKIPGFQGSHHIYVVNHLADLDASKLDSPSQYSLDSSAEDKPDSSIDLICKNDKECIVDKETSYPPTEHRMVSFSIGGIPYAHVAETGSGFRDMILRHSPQVSAAPNKPAPVPSPPASALPRREELEAAAKVIITVWKEQLSRDEAEKMLAGLGFTPFECSPPKDDTLAYVKLDCGTGTSPQFTFEYYRGSLKNVNVTFPVGDRTSYNYIFDELKKSANLGDITDEHDFNPAMVDLWDQGETTCIVGGGTCPQSVVALNYEPTKTNHNINISYRSTSTMNREIMEKVRRSR
jgi:hypothetical protein